MSAFTVFSRENGSPSSVMLEAPNNTTPAKSSIQQKKKATEKKAQNAAFSTLISENRFSEPIANMLQKRQLRKMQSKPNCKPGAIFRSIGGFIGINNAKNAKDVYSKVNYKRRRESSRKNSKKTMKLSTGVRVKGPKKTSVDQRKKPSFKAPSKRGREEKRASSQVSGVVVPQPKETVKVTVKRTNTTKGGPKYDLTERPPVTLIRPNMRPGAIGLRKQALLGQVKIMCAASLQSEIQHPRLPQMRGSGSRTEIESLIGKMKAFSICSSS